MGANLSVPRRWNVPVVLPACTAGERTRMNIFVAGSLWVAGAVSVAGVVAYLVRRFGWDEGRADNNDAAGQVFTIVGGLHAVLIAFVLISLFDSVSAAS